MEKNLVGEIFDTVKRAGLAANEGEFCEFWLGHSECYLRSVRFKKTNPSLGALAICASRLQRAGETMVVSRQFYRLGKQLLELSDRCHAEINKNALELELS